MLSVQTEISRITKKLKGHISALEPSFAALPQINQSPAKLKTPSAGDILISSRGYTPPSPDLEIKKIRKNFSLAMKKAEREMVELEDYGHDLQQIINHIEHGGELPATFSDPMLLASARSLRLAKTRSVVDLDATIKTAKRRIEDALIEIQRVRDVAFFSYKNTSRIIIARHAALRYRKCSESFPDGDPRALKFALKAKVQREVHQKYVAGNIDHAQRRDAQRAAGRSTLGLRRT